VRSLQWKPVARRDSVRAWTSTWNRACAICWPSVRSPRPCTAISGASTGATST